MYEDNEKKLYVILNRNHEVSTLMNAACHLSSGITVCAEGNVFDEYQNASSGLKANLSHYPVVVLQAKIVVNWPRRLRKLMKRVLLIISLRVQCFLIPLNSKFQTR